MARGNGRGSDATKKEEMSTKAPTVAEQAWMDDIVRLGCCVCWLQGHPRTPACVHHMLTEGGRRRGHKWTIPLCEPGHHKGGDGVKKISRHPWKGRFEEAYGTEDDLYAAT